MPIAVLVKWFPDRRGLITGIAVGGFGAGALVTAPVATRLIQSVGVLQTFAYLGIAYLIVTMACGLVHAESAGRMDAGGMDAERHADQRSDRLIDYTLGGALRTWQWWALWLAALPEYVGRHLADLAGIADLSGDREGHSAIVAGGHGGHRRASATRVGRIFWAAASGRDHAAMDVCGHVPGARWGFSWLMPGLASADHR